jgi:hypothetical protein
LGVIRFLMLLIDSLFVVRWWGGTGLLMAFSMALMAYLLLVKMHVSGVFAGVRDRAASMLYRFVL